MQKHTNHTKVLHTGARTALSLALSLSMALQSWPVASVAYATELGESQANVVKLEASEATGDVSDANEQQVVEDATTAEPTVEQQSDEQAAPEQPADEQTEAPTATDEASKEETGEPAPADDATPAAADEQQADASEPVSDDQAEQAEDTTVEEQRTTEDILADDKDEVAGVSFELDHASVTYGLGIIAQSTNNITVPAGQDVRFSVTVEDGYELNEVRLATATGSEQLDPLADGDYLVAGILVKGDLTISVTTHKEGEHAISERGYLMDKMNDQETFTYEDKDVKVTAKLSDPAALPEGVVFRVAPITKDDEEYNYDAYLEALNAEEKARADAAQTEAHPYTEQDTLLYDVGFFAQKVDEKGEPLDNAEVEVPLAAGEVELSFFFKGKQLDKELGAEADGEIEVVHLPLERKIRDKYDSTADATKFKASNVQVEGPKAGTLESDVARGQVSFALTSLSAIALRAAVAEPVEEEATTPASIAVADHGLQPILDAQPIAYKGTSEGIREESPTIEDQVVGNHHSYTVTYHYTITDDCDADELYIDTSNHSGDAAISSVQPGDDVTYRISVTDESGRDYQYVDGAGAVGTVAAAQGKTVGQGFDGYGIAAYTADQSSPTGKRALNAAIADLYELAGFKDIKHGDDTVYDFLMTQAPTDEYVGTALWCLGYPDGATHSLKQSEFADAKELQSHAPLAGEYLDDFYLDWMIAKSGKQYHSFVEAGNDDPQLLKSLFVAAGGAAAADESNPIVSNIMYYTYYQYLWTVSSDDNQGLYEVMKPRGDMKSVEYFAQGGNNYAPIFARQWHATDNDSEAAHTLSWTMSVDLGNNASALQNAKFFTAAQLKLEYVPEPVSIDFDTVYLGSDATKGMFTFRAMPATETYVPQVGGAGVMTTTNGDFQDGIANCSFVLEDLAEGLHYYIISEESAQGYTTDAAELLVAVNVKNGVPEVAYYALRTANGKVQDYTQVYLEKGDNHNVVTFFNNTEVKTGGRMRTFTANSARYVAYEPKVRKVLTNGTLYGGEFEFKLTGDQMSDTTASTATNDRDGIVEFGSILFDDTNIGSTMAYTITEVNTGKNYVTYSDMEVTLEIDITADQDGLPCVAATYRWVDENGCDQVFVDDASMDASGTEANVMSLSSLPAFVNSYETVVVRAQKRQRTYDAKGKVKLGEPLAGAHYGLWMVNPDGQDVYMGEGRNQEEAEGSEFGSDEEGYLYYDLPLTTGVAYYFREQGTPPEGHLIDPYPTDYFTLMSDETSGYSLVYEYDYGTTEEFLDWVRDMSTDQV